MVFRINNTPEGFTCDLQSNLDSWDEFRSENLGKWTILPYATCERREHKFDENLFVSPCFGLRSR